MNTNDRRVTETVDTDQAEPAYEAVLIFDGECPFCSAAATALRRLPDVGVIAWNDDTAQRFLTAQFGDPPFGLVFVDGTTDRLWIGSAAAGELCDRAGVPTLDQDIVADNFERVGDAVRGVAGAKREPTNLDGTRSLNAAAAVADDVPAIAAVDLDGTRSLNAAAAAEYQTLAANARRTHRTGGSR